MKDVEQKTMKDVEKETPRCARSLRVAQRRRLERRLHVTQGLGRMPQSLR